MSTIDHLFFYKALTTTQVKKQPLLEEIKSWLFIVADEIDQYQVLAFVEKNKGLNSYNQILLTTTQQRLSGFTSCQQIPQNPSRKSGSFSSRARRTISRPGLHQNFHLQIHSSTRIHEDLMSFRIECTIWSYGWSFIYG